MYTARLGPQPKKFLKKAEKEAYKRITTEIRELEQHPFPKDIKRIVCKTGKTAYRVSVGSWRIEYVVFHDKKELLIYKTQKRPKAY